MVACCRTVRAVKVQHENPAYSRAATNIIAKPRTTD